MKKGLEILLNTYWDSGGWKDGTISKEDFEVAKKDGFMFDYPKYISHDEALRKLDCLLKKSILKMLPMLFYIVYPQESLSIVLY